MPAERIAQTYSCKVVGLGNGDQAEYLRQNIKSGDALTLHPDPETPLGTAVYHYNRKIGDVAVGWLRDVLRPGFEYEATAGEIEYDDAGIPVVLRIQVTVYGVTKTKHIKHADHSSNSVAGGRSAAEDRESHDSCSIYVASPVMFRAHPIWFVIALLLTPAVIGIIILLIWMIQSRTTHLEIGGDTVRYETGVFSKDRRALSRRAIRTVRVSQSLLNRMLDVGAIEIFTAGDVPEIRAVSMFAPNEIRELLGR
jgi:membrane protein YdbS with pleckstrin-like domain